MVLQEETEHYLPSWEAWIHVTSKRRAVFALYLLHWSYSVYHRVASFNCEELSYIPAPAPKYLWQATSEEQWEGLYRRWLAQWNGQEFMQHEFMCITPGPFLDERAQLWLEDTDEFGMLFASICMFSAFAVAAVHANCSKSTRQIEKLMDSCLDVSISLPNGLQARVLVPFILEVEYNLLVTLLNTSTSTHIFSQEGSIGF